MPLPARRGRMWNGPSARSVVYKGDVNEACKWLGVAQSKLISMMATNPGPMSVTYQPAPGITISIDTRPQRIEIDASGGLHLSIMHDGSAPSTYPTFTSPPYQSWRTRDVMDALGKVVLRDEYYTGRYAWVNLSLNKTVSWNYRTIYINGSFCNLPITSGEILCAARMSNSVKSALVARGGFISATSELVILLVGTYGYGGSGATGFSKILCYGLDRVGTGPTMTSTSVASYNITTSDVPTAKTAGVRSCEFTKAGDGILAVTNNSAWRLDTTLFVGPVGTAVYLTVTFMNLWSPAVLDSHVSQTLTYTPTAHSVSATTTDWYFLAEDVVISSSGPVYSTGAANLVSGWATPSYFYITYIKIGAVSYSDSEHSYTEYQRIRVDATHLRSFQTDSWTFTETGSITSSVRWDLCLARVDLATNTLDMNYAVITSFTEQDNTTFNNSEVWDRYTGGSNSLSTSSDKISYSVDLKYASPEDEFFVWILTKTTYSNSVSGGASLSAALGAGHSGTGLTATGTTTTTTSTTIDRQVVGRKLSGVEAVIINDPGTASISSTSAAQGSVVSYTPTGGVGAVSGTTVNTLVYPRLQIDPGWNMDAHYSWKHIKGAILLSTLYGFKEITCLKPLGPSSAVYTRNNYGTAEDDFSISVV